jgi:hypothetical protein
METDRFRWLIYAVVVVLFVGVAGAGFLHVLSLTEERSITTQGTHNITEDAEEGVVEMEINEIVIVRKTVVETGIPLVGEVVTEKEETEYDRLNVTTVEGGGTGEFLDGYETGDIVTLEATDEPEWQEEGTGEYSADGDEIRLIVVSPSGKRSVFKTYRTTAQNQNLSEGD